MAHKYKYRLPISPAAFIEAAEKVEAALVEVTRQQANRAKRPLERRMAAAVGPAFTKEGRAILRALNRYRGAVNRNAAQLAETAVVENSNLITTLNRSIMAVLTDTGPVFSELIVEGAVDSYVVGGNNSFRNLLVPFFWVPADPRAVEYATNHAATQVTQIQNTTRKTLNRLVTTAVQNGTSYNNLAAQIRERYGRWAGTTDQRASLSSKARSVRIARFEVGDAYEAGHYSAAGETWASGVEIQKKWLSARDANVRPTHRASDRQGWINFGANWAANVDRPPEDPGCRCAQLFRRAR